MKPPAKASATPRRYFTCAPKGRFPLDARPVNRKRKLTIQELRDLDFEIDFMQRIVLRDPKYVEALQVLSANYMRRGNYIDGLKVDRRLVRLAPGDPTILYNLACSLCLNHRLKQALAALNKAIDCGFDDYHLLMRDPDLDALRAGHDFDEIRERILLMDH